MRKIKHNQGFLIVRLVSPQYHAWRDFKNGEKLSINVNNDDDDSR